ncbi:FAD:protein FMN transferase [Alkaliphilus serpentinus]|uniref:FAD:protein FMN transferase n=1 Tax=Alkaliphilus serpentinus TaxID=1482731 RepID=A0A833HQ28_9FIRM|nr:FAD:protein FMN transferase [Alkaliphilus serpentinus]KAB3531468.1 FAD:protein FMN transferase [Alkaliphilus serpentinus]
MKKITIVFITIFMLISQIGCQGTDQVDYAKYSDSFFDTFDTLMVVVAYTETEEEFRNYFKLIQEGFQRYHKLYDIYNNYDGVNNIKTINDNAGIKPVRVDKEIIDLILFAKDWNRKTGGNTNIAFGPVLKIWHDYRQEGIDDPENAKYPPMEKLTEAFKLTDIDKVVVNVEDSTVFLQEKGMSLDVGAVAKGYATELVVQEAQKAGLKSGIISAGGNVRTIGKPMDNIRERWVVAIQDPNKSIFSEDKDLDAVFVNDASIVTSGDYQRYYFVGDELVHHLIDPKTLMPANYYKAVTIVAPDAGVADFLSTVVFLEPHEKSSQIIKDLEGVEAVWVMPDGSVKVSEGMKKILKSYGATNQK